MNWYKKAQIPNESALRELAIRLIKEVWRRFPSQDYDERYNAYNMRLMIDNEEDLSTLKSRFGEDAQEMIDGLIDDELFKAEQKVYKRREKKIKGGDELQHIRDAVRGKNWEQAKLEIAKLRIPNISDEEQDVEDEKAEEFFRSLYVTTYGGTFVDLEMVRQNSSFRDPATGEYVLKRLSEIKQWKQYGAGTESDEELNRYHETQLWNALFGSAKSAPPSIKVYRGVVKAGAEIRPGDYVTPDVDYARAYMRGKSGAVISAILPIDDLILSNIPYGYEAVELVYYPRNFNPQKQDIKVPTFREFWTQVNSQ